MKITPKQYAQSLYESVKGKDKKAASQTVERFFKVLAGNNEVRKAAKIIEQFSKIWDRENDIVEAEVTTAREYDKEIDKLINEYIAKETGAKNVVVKNKVSKDVLGGVVVRYGDQIIDGSLKTKISSLKEEMVK